jgi:hypothetical protein
LLYLIRYWLWESSEGRFIAARLKRGEVLTHSAVNEQLPEGENLSGFLIPAPKRPAEASGDSQ